MIKQKIWKKRILASILAMAMVLPIPAVAEAQGTPIDTEGPDYYGTVIMAENMNFSIGSDEELTLTQNVGLDSLGQAVPREVQEKAA